MAALQGHAAVSSGQGLQIGDDGLHLLVGQRRIQLGNAHFSNRIIERLGAAVMEVRRRRRDVPQARHAQDFGFGRPQRMEDPVPLEQIAADIHALMAGDAAQRLEQAIPFLFLRRERTRVALQPAIESAAWRHQGSLEARQRIHNRVGIGPATIGSGEFPVQTGVGTEFLCEFGNIGPHDLGV